jgi:hypothetical protein
MLDAVSELLRSKKIPPLDAVQMSALLHYVFTGADPPLRIQIAEVVYRYDHEHPHALDLFLTGTLPLAEKIARSKANKTFLYPSDWQIELMYDGAVAATISFFQSNRSVRPGPDAFQRYLLRSLTLGAVWHYFRRQENQSIHSVADVRTVRTPRKPFRNSIEQNIITRELLEQVTNYPELRTPVRETLQCIATLGPDAALKEHALAVWGDRDKWERQRGGRPILNPEAIAKAMGIPKRDVHRYLGQARAILREVFNADGKLFLTH